MRIEVPPVRIQDVKLALNDFGEIITWRTLVDAHTKNRYKVDYTLYPYLDYQGMINQGYGPAVTIKGRYIKLLKDTNQLINYRPIKVNKLY